MRHYAGRKLLAAMLAIGMTVSMAGMTRVQAAWDITSGGGSSSQQETTAAPETTAAQETAAAQGTSGGKGSSGAAGKTASAYDWLTGGTEKPTE